MITHTSRNGRKYSIPDLTGSRFGRLLVLDYLGLRHPEKGRGDHLWMCRCDCGTERPLLFRSLKRGLALSCGCLRKDALERTGEDHPAYKTGKTHDANGYVVLSSKAHGPQRHMREHRAVMEAHLGRKLHRNEVVHHRNENKADNRLENLEVMTRAEHAKHHHGR